MFFVSISNKSANNLQENLISSHKIVNVVDAEVYKKQREKFSGWTYSWLNSFFKGIPSKNLVDSKNSFLVMFDEFVLCKDFCYEWAGLKKAPWEIHYVLWFKSSQIKSVRDLNHSHVELIKKAIEVKVF